MCTLIQILKKIGLKKGFAEVASLAATGGQRYWKRKRQDAHRGKRQHVRISKNLKNHVPAHRTCTVQEDGVAEMETTIKTVLKLNLTPRGQDSSVQRQIPPAN